MEQREAQTPKRMCCGMEKVLKHSFSEHTPFPSDLSLKGIQASALTLITLV